MPVHDSPIDPEAEQLSLARAGNAAAFDRLVSPRRRLLHTHCYRMLGSPADADDALQETLLAAWRGLAGFEARSALTSWLYRIATHVCLRLIAQRPRRITSPDHAAALVSTAELGEPVEGPVWLEPLADSEWELPETAHDPLATLARREHVALAFVAALQHLPATQRAVLLLRDVLEYSAAETADMLDTTVASVNSALQRAQKTVKDLTPEDAPVARTSEPELQALLGRFVSAWESRDIDAMVALLAEDARFTMPPLPAWFAGRRSVALFFAERVFRTPWRLARIGANGQPAFVCTMKPEGEHGFRPGGVVLLRVAGGLVTSIDSFIDPAVGERFGMKAEPG